MKSSWENMHPDFRVERGKCSIQLTAKDANKTATNFNWSLVAKKNSYYFGQ